LVSVSKVAVSSVSLSSSFTAQARIAALPDPGSCGAHGAGGSEAIPLHAQHSQLLMAFRLCTYDPRDGGSTEGCGAVLPRGGDDHLKRMAASVDQNCIPESAMGWAKGKVSDSSSGTEQHRALEVRSDR